MNKLQNILLSCNNIFLQLGHCFKNKSKILLGYSENSHLLESVSLCLSSFLVSKQCTVVNVEALPLPILISQSYKYDLLIYVTDIGEMVNIEVWKQEKKIFSEKLVNNNYFDWGQMIKRTDLAFDYKSLISNYIKPIINPYATLVDCSGGACAQILPELVTSLGDNLSIGFINILDEDPMQARKKFIQMLINEKDRIGIKIDKTGSSYNFFNSNGEDVTQVILRESNDYLDKWFYTEQNILLLIIKLLELIANNIIKI
ncbi:hypothetical protein [Massiliimalia timonensis]|uniref:hypothetical protein n=1 Tax=Massiliimalia timonensis TaxID=1987501 RepID=UPI0018A10D1A|nr:hypothetical protein [Massiliimalia timonensis]